jgi:ribosome biogenesis GTPase
LINRLLGESRQATNEVRAGDSHGRHTTTRRELVLLPSGGAVIDTPGLREVGIVADQESLDRAFEDVAELAAECHFNDCRHESEPGCAVRAAVDAGTIAPDRVQSYLRVRLEGENAALRQDEHARRQEERQTIGHYRRWLQETHRFKGKS